MTGRLMGIARRAARRTPMEEVSAGTIDLATGLAGDFKGAKYPRRQITILSREAWSEALATLTDLGGPVPLPWTTRRANLLVEGVDLPRAKGGLVRVGAVVLEVTGQTYPCARMEEAHPGLLKALAPAWRGGVTCRVRDAGEIAVGDSVEILFAPPEQKVRLPG